MDLHRPETPVIGIHASPAARLTPDAISTRDGTVIGLSNAAPAASVGLTLAALAAASAYGSGLVILVTAIPMLIISNAYRQLNKWNANCGASFEWVGRAINPYLGFVTGWLMIAATIIGTVSCVENLGPSVLAVFGSSNSANTWANILIGTTVCLVMLLTAIAGIRVTARSQIGMAIVEYAILLGFAVAGLVFVLLRHPGTVPIGRGWMSLTGMGGQGNAAAGFLIAVFLYTGWDGALYVNEEVTNRNRNPGRAAVMAVALLAVIYTVSEVGLQGVVSPAKLQANSSSALVYVAQAVAGSTGGRLMALALALSVTATCGVGIVLTARIICGMAGAVEFRGLLRPGTRHRVPVAASVIVGVLVIILTWVYLLASSVQGAFTAAIDATGMLFAMFYILTAIATVTYFRRRLARPADALLLGILPLGAAGFLGWIVVQSLASASAAEIWSLVGVAAVGLCLMLASRFALRSPYFRVRRETGAADPDPWVNKR
jgi:amino acid transporter